MASKRFSRALPAVTAAALAASLLAAAVHAAQTSAEPGDEYVVYVDAVNLRAEPDAGAEVMRVLTSGERLRGLGEAVFDAKADAMAEPEVWRPVRAGDDAGWVPDRYILSASLYEAFREADRLGKAGDAAGMLLAVKNSIRAFPPRRRDEGKTPLNAERMWADVDASPDGSKVVVALWGDGGIGPGDYPDAGRIGSGFAVLLFAQGRGLVEYYRSFKVIDGKWSPDSRYYLYAAAFITEGPSDDALLVLDTATWRRKELGLLATSAEFDFFGGYILWPAKEEVLKPRPPLKEPSFEGVLNAYELATGKTVRLLEPDLTTVEEGAVERYGQWGIKYYPADLLPAPLCPEALKTSPLYIKYVNEPTWVEDRSEYDPTGGA